jgi:hypothetical protein
LSPQNPFFALVFFKIGAHPFAPPSVSLVAVITGTCHHT